MRSSGRVPWGDATPAKAGSAVRSSAGLLCCALLLARPALCAELEFVTPSGRLMEISTGCEVWNTEKRSWIALHLREPTIVADQRIRCVPRGRIKLALPGNQKVQEIAFPDSKFEYVVPIGRDLPALPDSKTLGRKASLDTGQSLAPMALGNKASPLFAGSPTGVERCDRKLGVLVIAEPKEGDGNLAGYGLGSPAKLLRTLALQSGCFELAEPNPALAALYRERALAGDPSEMRGLSNLAKGSMRAADFVLTPEVQIAGNSTGSGLGGLTGGSFGALASSRGNMKFRDATTSLLLADLRSGVQLAGAESQAGKIDLSATVWDIDAGMGASLGGYASTPEGKLIATGFLDSFNKIVLAVREQQDMSGGANRVSQAWRISPPGSGFVVAEGQPLMVKVTNVKAYAGPARDSKVVATLGLDDLMVATGEMKDGFVKINTPNFSGWVQGYLVKPSGRDPVAPTPREN